jgi:hypothetical protein
MALSFPPNPLVGQTYTGPNGVTYRWDGSKWVAQGTSSGSGGGGGGGGGAGASTIFSNGTIITTTATQIDFVGAVVTATSSGTLVSVKINIPATTSTLGVIKVGPTLSIAGDGTLNAVSGNLTYWQEANQIHSFNDSASIFSAIGVQSNIDAIISTKGTGAHVGILDGNIRGQYATDWQKVPGDYNNIASGNYGVIGGGSLNKASALHSVIIGGNNNLSDATYSTVLGGRGGNTNGITGATIIPGAAGLQHTNSGVAQAGVYLLSGESYNNSVIVLTTDGTGSATTGNQLTLKDNSAIHFRGMVIAKEYQKYRGEVWTWTFEGAIRRDVGSTTTDFAPSAILPPISLQYGINTSSNWGLLLDIDNQHGALVIKARGGSTQHIRWVCRIDTVETSDLS